MKYSLLSLVLLCFTFSSAAQSSSQYGRIVDIKKSVSNYTKAWVVNTPVSEERTVYKITVHVPAGLVTGEYEVTPEHSEPPTDWVNGYALKVQLTGDSMDLHGPTGSRQLRVIQRKSVPNAMEPLNEAEKKRLADMEEPAGGMIGFAERTQETKESKPAPAPEPAATTATPPPAPTGSVEVRSTPFLSEVFVDGESMGYTPAKINLAPGKHSFRIEKPGYKPWTKEMTLTVGSQLTLDATLEKK
jgi:hypothetical protein